VTNKLKFVAQILLPEIVVVAVERLFLARQEVGLRISPAIPQAQAYGRQNTGIPSAAVFEKSDRTHEITNHLLNQNHIPILGTMNPEINQNQTTKF
jgi:hypothetical protein